MRFSLSLRAWVLIILAALPAIFFTEAQGANAPATGRPPLLAAAFNAFLDDQARWAYTETHAWSGPDGKPSGETAIFRVDPSLSYAEQYFPVKLGVKPPSEKQLKQWAERGEQEAKRRQEDMVDEKSALYHKEDFYLQIYDQKVTPLLEQAVVVAEDENDVTYAVPLRKAGRADKALFNQFELTTRVSKQRHQFDRVTIRQRSPMRVVAAKYTDGLIEIEFATPDARFQSVPVKTSSQTTIKPLFVKASTRYEVAVRSDLRHVTPYDERFGVKIGPMRTIKF